LSLIETLPEPLHKVLSDKNAPAHSGSAADSDHTNGGIGDVVIAVAADFTLDGTYGEEWLVVTRDHLRVYSLSAPFSNGVTHAPNSATHLNGAAAKGVGSDASASNNGTELVQRLDVPLSDLRAPRMDSLIGGGALQANVDGKTIELVRYTNARQRVFGRVAKYLDDVAQYYDALRKQEEVKEPVLEEDTEEEKRCPNCGLLLPEGTTVCPACMNKARVLARLAKYLAPYKKQSFLLSLMILASTALGLIAPYLTRPLMDTVLVPQGQLLPIERRTALLGLIVLGMLSSQLLSNVLNVFQGRVAAWLTHQLAHGLRVELYAHLQRLSLRFFDKRQIGSLMTRVTQDTQELESVLTIGAQFFVANLLTLIGIIAVLCWLDWRLFLQVMIPIPLVFYLSRHFWQKIQTVWPRWWHYRSRLSAVLNDSLSGVRVVKAFAQEGREIERFNPRSWNYPTPAFMRNRRG
jgi:ATP-binding cassette subfamily B protein